MREIDNRVFKYVGVSGVDQKRIVQVGVSTDNSATVRMRSSNNVKTWGNLREASNGSLGEYDKRVTWYGCGSSLNLWVPEIVVSDAIPWRILNADVKGINIQGVTDGAT